MASPKERPEKAIIHELNYQARKRGMSLEEYMFMRANPPTGRGKARSPTLDRILAPYVGKKPGTKVKPVIDINQPRGKPGPKPKTKLRIKKQQQAIENKSKNFVNNKDLVEQIAISKAQNKITDHLAKMFIEMVKRYSMKSNFAKYTYIEDMQSHAIETLVKNWMKFDESKFDNAFAYYTSFIHNAFIQFLNKERHSRDLRDKLMVNAGLNPSFNYEGDDE